MDGGRVFQLPSYLFDKRRCVEALESTRKAVQESKMKGNFQIMSSVGDPKSGGRSATLEGLKVISLPELIVGHVHRGRVLHGRLCAKPVMMAGVHTIFEQGFGIAVRLCIYNAVRSMASPKEVEAHFPAGLKVAIKEPYFKWGQDGTALVRVDNPADIVHILDCKDNDVGVDSKDEAKIVESLQVIRFEGNKLFEKEVWIGAVAKYSECIDEAVRKGKYLKGRSENFNNVMSLAYSNRAEALLRLQNFEGALSDAEKALELDPTHLKSLSRQGRAAMEIGFYEKACNAFEAVLKRHPGEASIVEMLKSSKSCLEQSRTGKVREHIIGFLGERLSKVR